MCEFISATFSVTSTILLSGMALKVLRLFIGFIFYHLTVVQDVRCSHSDVYGKLKCTSLCCVISHYILEDLNLHVFCMCVKG